MRVISENIPHFRSISLGFWVPAGPRDENRKNNGITHLIEHCIFKGTQSRTYRDIAVQFDAMGADFNAFTDKEYCCVYAGFIDEDLPECMELLLDIICNPTFHTEHLETEKKIIAEEIKMSEDNPYELLLNHFYSKVFDGHPLSMPILGSAGTLRKMSKKVITGYFNKNFNLANMVISAAGNVQHEKLIELIERYIKKADYGSNVKDVPAVRVPGNGAGTHIVKNGKSKAVHICMGGTGCDRKSSDRYPLSLLTNILGGNMSSRLFQRIREDEGLAYTVSASNIQYTDTGLVLIHSASSAGNVKKILEHIAEELAVIAEKGIEKEELERAKENMKGGIVLAVEDINSRMFRLGKTMLFDRKVLTIDEILMKIDDIRISDVNGLVNKYFNPENLVTVIMGKNVKGII